MYESVRPTSLKARYPFFVRSRCTVGSVRIENRSFPSNTARIQNGRVKPIPIAVRGLPGPIPARRSEVRRVLAGIVFGRKLGDVLANTAGRSVRPSPGTGPGARPARVVFHRQGRASAGRRLLRDQVKASNVAFRSRFAKTIKTRMTPLPSRRRIGTVVSTRPFGAAVVRTNRPSPRYPNVISRFLPPVLRPPFRND